jgi:hypothetical protein
MFSNPTINQKYNIEEINNFATQIYYFDTTQEDLSIPVFEMTKNAIGEIIVYIVSGEAVLSGVSFWITPKEDVIGLPGTAKAAGEYAFVPIEDDRNTDVSIQLSNDLNDRSAEMIIMTGQGDAQNMHLLEVVAQVKYSHNEVMTSTILRQNMLMFFPKAYNYFDL